MGAEKLQGTPWHPDQLHKTCKDGSKYCAIETVLSAAECALAERVCALIASL